MNPKFSLLTHGEPSTQLKLSFMCQKRTLPGHMLGIIKIKSYHLKALNH